MGQKGKILLLSAQKGAPFEFLQKLSGVPDKDWGRAYNPMALPNDEVTAVRSAAPLTIVLGHEVRRFLELPEAPWILPQDHPSGLWRFLPHPSVRTQMYNDPIFRAAVRLLLQELVT